MGEFENFVSTFRSNSREVMVLHGSTFTNVRTFLKNHMQDLSVSADFFVGANDPRPSSVVFVILSTIVASIHFAVTRI